MQSLPKLAWSLVGTALFLGLIYFVFQDNRVFDVIFPSNVFGSEVKATFETARDKIYNIINPVVAPVFNQGKKSVEGLYNTIKNEIEDLIDRAKGNAVSSVKTVLNNKIDSLAQTIGVAEKPEEIPLKNEVVVVPDFPLGFTLKINAPTVFVIRDTTKDNKSMSYAVDWGDTTKETGEVPSSATRPLYHTWIEAGEYSVKISTNDSGVKKLFSTYMVVF